MPDILVKYSKKENDMMVHWDSELGKANPGWFMSIFAKELLDEMERRGYDTKTIRFSINKKK